jgi:choline dehydrogenase-like flavoprotein
LTGAGPSEKVSSVFPMDFPSGTRLPGERESRAAAAIARALIPESKIARGGDLQTVHHTERFLSKAFPELLGPYRALQFALSEAARPFTGQRFEDLDEETAEKLVTRWLTHPVLSKLVVPLGTLYRMTHFDRPDVKGPLGYSLPTIENIEQPRWLSQTIAARDYPDSEDLECDVVVIGTGAGGAVVGRHLTDQGLAVVFVEEGEHLRRNDFPGTLVGTVQDVYRNTLSIGNVPIPVLQGRLVGGSTAVNGGSSFRPPPWVTDRWCEELGSAEFSSEALDPYFERTESILQVEPADARYAGPLHTAFERGADALGWHHELMLRNAPGCQGDGFCDHGCKTDARRSTNIAYLPPALEKGAFLMYGLRADKLLTDGSRATGIEGVAVLRDKSVARLPNGKPKRVRIRARAVILAGGAVSSPVFLLKQGLGNSSGQVGRNMTFHPSGPTTALFSEVMDTARYIPQADFSTQFLKDGVLLLSAGPDFQTLPPLLPFFGRQLTDVLEKHRHLAGMGYLLADDARGRIRLGPGGHPITTYSLSNVDLEHARLGIAACARLLFAAGAKEVYPGITKPLRWTSERDILEFEKQRLSAGSLILMSYHPLGSCKMSQDPSQGVVDTNHECHDVKGLFIVDGSTVSGPLGVNPQITIMGFATRAAEKIGQILEKREAVH